MYWFYTEIIPSNFLLYAASENRLKIQIKMGFLFDRIGHESPKVKIEHTPFKLAFRDSQFVHPRFTDLPRSLPRSIFFPLTVIASIDLQALRFHMTVGIVSNWAPNFISN